MNPLVPSALDVLGASAVILNTALVVIALIALVRAADKRRWVSTLLFIVFVPFVGPVVAIIALHARKPTPTCATEYDAMPTP